MIASQCVVVFIHTDPGLCDFTTDRAELKDHAGPNLSQRDSSGSRREAEYKVLVQLIGLLRVCISPEHDSTKLVYDTLSSIRPRSVEAQCTCCASDSYIE